MGPVFKFQSAAASETHPSLVHQSSRLQRVFRPLAGHFGSSESSQLGVDQRQQFIGSLTVAVPNAIENPGDIAHPFCLSDDPSPQKQQLLPVSALVTQEGQPLMGK